MAGIRGAIVDEGQLVGVKDTPTKNTEATRGTDALGKDSFLKLLVAQMQHQDPLQPSSDTEWIAQMAQFSSLEHMQNMSSTMLNSQALSLVGQSVIVKTKLETGEQTLKGGVVDYVVIQEGDAYLNINGELYPMEDLDTVADEEYLKKLAEAGEVEIIEEEEEGDKEGSGTAPVEEGEGSESAPAEDGGEEATATE